MRKNKVTETVEVDNASSKNKSSDEDEKEVWGPDTVTKTETPKPERNMVKLYLLV